MVLDSLNFTAEKTYIGEFKTVFLVFVFPQIKLVQDSFKNPSTSWA